MKLQINSTELIFPFYVYKDTSNGVVKEIEDIIPLEEEERESLMEVLEEEKSRGNQFIEEMKNEGEEQE